MTIPFRRQTSVAARLSNRQRVFLLQPIHVPVDTFKRETNLFISGKNSATRSTAAQGQGRIVRKNMRVFGTSAQAAASFSLLFGPW